VKKYLIILLSTIIFINIPFLNLFKLYIIEEIQKKYPIEISIDSIDHTLLSVNHIKISNITIKKDKNIIFNNKNLELKFQIIPLLKKIVIIDYVLIDSFKINMSSKDLLIFKNKESNSKKEKIDLKFYINRLKINDSSIKYNDYKIENLFLLSSLKDQNVKIDQLDFDFFQGHFQIEALIDLNNKKLKTKGKINKISLSNLNPFLKKKNIKLDGIINSDFNITKTNNINGQLNISGKQIKLKGIDIDQLINGFMDSREVGLLDVASYMTLGPLGMIFTNSLEAIKSASGLSGKSLINHLNINAKINNSNIIMKDVGFSSKNNRIIAKGSINIETLSFNKFKVHILNEEACSRFHQEISGTIKSPEIGVTKTISSGIISPITNLIDKPSNIISSCNPIYNGKIKHP
jgi:hypothetical protein